MRHSLRTRSIIMTNSVPLVSVTVVSSTVNRIRLHQDVSGLPADSWPFMGSSRRWFWNMTVLCILFKLTLPTKSFRDCQEGWETVTGKVKSVPVMLKTFSSPKDRTARVYPESRTKRHEWRSKLSLGGIDFPAWRYRARPRARRSSR